MPPTKSDRPTVWITNETKRRVNNAMVPAYDTGPAEAWGTLRVVLPDNIKPWDATTAVAHAASAMEDDYEPERDFIIPMGAPILTGIVFAQAVLLANDEGCSHLRVLQWDKRDRAYTEVLVPLRRLFVHGGDGHE